MLENEGKVQEVEKQGLRHSTRYFRFHVRKFSKFLLPGNIDLRLRKMTHTQR